MPAVPALPFRQFNLLAVLALPSRQFNLLAVPAHPSRQFNLLVVPEHLSRLPRLLRLFSAEHYFKVSYDFKSQAPQQILPSGRICFLGAFSA